MAKLIVRKEKLNSFADFDFHGISLRVDLSTATQEQLAYLKELGMDIFEKEAKAEKEK